MQPERRDTLLSVLGVVQYRKRSSRAVTESSEEGVELASQSQTEPMDVPVTPRNPVENIRRPVEDVVKDNDASHEEQIPSSQRATQSETAVSAASEQSSQLATREFDLLFWRSGNLLAMETSRGQQGSVESKHRLTNNIFRAIYGESYKGAPMYSLSWPDVVASTNQKSDKSDSASEAWLRAFLKGQLTQDPQTRLWMMGDDVLELLLAKHGAKEDIQGARLQDSQLGMEVFVTAPLGEMMAKPYLKASAWQLLGKLTH